MTIRFVLRKQEMLLDETNIQVKQAFAQLALSPQAYLMVRDGELLNENDRLRDGDQIKLIPVISGGGV